MLSYDVTLRSITCSVKTADVVKLAFSPSVYVYVIVLGIEVEGNFEATLDSSSTEIASTTTNVIYRPTQYVAYTSIAMTRHTHQEQA